jgi:TonB-linked SusC/RagA family outer membrane protein
MQRLLPGHFSTLPVIYRKLVFKIKRNLYFVYFPGIIFKPFIYNQVRKLICICLYCFVWSSAYSQMKQISGTVKDEKGDPVPSASVLVKNTKTGTFTQTNGSFILDVPLSSDTLIITSVGYFSQAVGIRDSVRIILRSSEGSLSEVQIVGYGTQVKTNQTGSASTIKAAYLEDKPFSSVDKTLQGAVAGLQSSSTSGAPGSMTGVLIRGIGSITAGSDPLWVIDGTIATTGDQSEETTTSNVLSSLNPDDIESITVLKDAATTSVYGSRAANGVIMVSTKKGVQGSTLVTASAEVGANSIAFIPGNKPMNSIETQTLLRQAVINAGLATDNAGADFYISDTTSGLGINPAYTQTNTNWLDVISRTALQSQYNVSISGGSNKTQFYVSGGLFNQEGTIIASSFKRYNGDLSLSQKVNDKFSFNAMLSGSAANQNTPNNSGLFANPIADQIYLLPWYTPYNTDGTVKFNDSGPYPEFPADGQYRYYNPVAIAQMDEYNYQQNVIRGNVSGKYIILENLVFTTQYSGEYFNINEHFYENPFYGDGPPTQGYVSDTYKKIFNWTWTNILDYHRKLINDFSFDVKLGYEAYEQNNYELISVGTQFPYNLTLQYLASSGSPVYGSSDIYSNSTNSVFTIADLNYHDRYVISGSFRRDASSRFGVDDKWGSFYSVGGAWNVSKETYFENKKLLSLLKLRMSYGITGNQNIGDYTAQATYGYGNNYGGFPGSALNNVGNTNLTWEKNAIFNIGIDFALFDNRFSGTVEYYNRTTSNLIVAVPLSLTQGIGSQNRNVGSVNNKGIEITLGVKPVVTQNFTWNINLNFAHNINRVTQLYLGNPVPQGPANITVGHDITEYWLPIWAGVNTANGKPQWYTDGSKSQITGNYDSAQSSFNNQSATPKYFGSLTNTFAYKHFSLQIQAYYSYGNYIQDIHGGFSNSDGEFLGSYNQLSADLSPWQHPGDKTNIPQVILGGNNNSNGTSTRYLYNGDYIRLRNVTLNYTFLNGGLQRLGVSNLSVYLRCTNLLTYVKDKNLPIDPEEGATQANLDIYQPKTIAGGIKIIF